MTVGLLALVAALRKITMNTHDGEIVWHIDSSTIPNYWMLGRLILANTFDCETDRRVFPHCFFFTVQLTYLLCSSTVGQLDLHDILMPPFSHSWPIARTLGTISFSETKTNEIQ